MGREDPRTEYIFLAPICPYVIEDGREFRKSQYTDTNEIITQTNFKLPQSLAQGNEHYIVSP